MKKILLGIRSLLFFFRTKLKYGKKIQIHMMNSIRGKFIIDLQSKSKLKIGTFLMSQGPLYLKAVDNGQIIIGNNVFLNHNVSITAADSVVIGDGVDIANNVVIVDHDHKMNDTGVTGDLGTAPVQIDRHTWIGANVTITKGVHIGEGSIIAAGAVVTKSVPSFCVAACIPAKVVKDNRG